MREAQIRAGRDGGNWKYARVTTHVTKGCLSEGGCGEGRSTALSDSGRHGVAYVQKTARLKLGYVESFDSVKLNKIAFGYYRNLRDVFFIS